MNIFKKTEKNNKKSSYRLCRLSYMMLRAGLPIVLLYLLLFLFMIESEGLPGYILAKKYAYTLEHIIMSATIIVIGALGSDIAMKREK